MDIRGHEVEFHSFSKVGYLYPIDPLLPQDVLPEGRPWAGEKNSRKQILINVQERRKRGTKETNSSREPLGSSRKVKIRTLTYRWKRKFGH
jgi:hypothetical protein